MNKSYIEIPSYYNKIKMYALTLLFSVLVLIVNAENYPYHSDILWVTTPNHTNWLYKVNEKAEITVSVYEYGILMDNVEITYALGPDMLSATESGTTRLKDGIAIIQLGTMTTPGFKDCQLQLKFKNQTYKHHIKIGFDPEKLHPNTKLPNDFESFWEDAKEKASACPIQITKVEAPEFSSDKVECYLVKLQVYEKGQFVYGYLTKPREEGKYPVVFSPPGAGIKPLNPMKDIFYAENGFIRFDMEIHGIRPNIDPDTYKEISQAFGHRNNSYLVNGLDNKDNYYMKKVYLSCIRAIDYLTSLPEWDRKNVIAQGGSQGGALALVTTGLDSRITACAANHPALSDMAGYLDNRAGGYPHLFTKFDGMNTPEIIETLNYYDVVNFAKQINVPVFMTWGFNDNTCPPTTSYVVYNSLNCNKEALITPVNEHWISLTTRHAIMDWIKEHLK